MIPILSSYDSHEILKSFQLKKYRTYVWISLLVFVILFVEAFVFFLIEEDAIQITAWLLLIPAIIALITLFIYRRKYNDLKQDVVTNPIESLYDDYDTDAAKCLFYYYVQSGKSQSMSPLIGLFKEQTLELRHLKSGYPLYKTISPLTSVRVVLYQKEHNDIKKFSDKIHIHIEGKTHRLYLLQGTHGPLMRFMDHQHIAYEIIKKGS